MSNADLRDDFFAELATDWQKIIARKSLPAVALPSIRENADGAWTVYVRDSDTWARFLWVKASESGNKDELYASYIVCHSFDMMGEPIFYDNNIGEGANARATPINIKLAMLQEARDRLLETRTSEQLSEAFVAIRMVIDPIEEVAPVTEDKVVNNSNVTAEDVKKPSSTESQA